MTIRFSFIVLILFSLKVFFSQGFTQEQISFHLYDEPTKTIIAEYSNLKSNDLIDLQKLPSKKFNIVIESKLKFASLTASHNGGRLHNENQAPFTALKEDGTAGAKLIEGSHTFLVKLKFVR